MRKTLVLLLLAVVGMASLNAQVLPKEEVVRVHPHKYFSVGLLGGIDRNYHVADLSYMNTYGYSKYTEGKSYGLQFGFSPWRWMTIRVDGVMIEKNVNRTHLVSRTGTSYPDTSLNQYVNVPLLLQFNIGKVVRLHAFGGGYWGYWLSSTHSGRTMGLSGDYEYNERVDFNSSESLVRDNRTELGLTYGAGLSTILFNTVEVGVELRWYYSVTDVQKPYMANLNPHYNTTFVGQLGLSYLF